MGIKKSKRIKKRNKAEDIAKTYAKIRDNYTCQKCLKKVIKHNCHVSHVKSKGAYPRLRCDPENLKVLCYYCHIHWWHKEPTEAGEWFKNKFPLRWEYLQEAKLNQNKLTEEDYDNIIEDLKDKLVTLDLRTSHG